jgi:Protein of unknown function (DUF4238)
VEASSLPTVRREARPLKPNLYSLEKVAPRRRQLLESGFMTRHIDTPAADIVAKMLSGQFANLTHVERCNFARFLLSLRARHPDAVALVRKQGRLELMAALSRDPEEYSALKTPSSASTLVDFVEQRIPGLIQNFGMLNLPSLIANDVVSERLYKMPWWVDDVEGASIDLLLSDRPCLLNGSAVCGPCLIVLPISPTMIFFACNEVAKIEVSRSHAAAKLVKAVNKLSVENAAERVYARNSHHLPLVEKYLKR